MVVVVYKKTNGMLHDLQWKEEKDKDADDFILKGFDHVPGMEEVKTLHDEEYLLAQVKEEKIQAEIARIKEAENLQYRVQAVTNIEAKTGIARE